MSNPEKYRQYITDIRGRQYMAVDGRIAMLVDEHRAAGKQFNISFENEWVRAAKEIAAASKGDVAEALKLIPEGLRNILRCVVTSELFGRFEGSAKIAWDGQGVDRTNPWENAETSAAGRALGFMGYGLLGGGIASAEEVNRALKEQERPMPSPIQTQAAPAVESPTPKPNDDTALEKPTEDRALTQSNGPCVDCQHPLKPPVIKFITKQREGGNATRWAHSSVKGLKCPE